MGGQEGRPTGGDITLTVSHRVVGGQEGRPTGGDITLTISHRVVGVRKAALLGMILHLPYLTG